MLITCPSCASAYELDPGRIGSGGRTVRCAGCRESWFIASPAGDPGRDGGQEPEAAAGSDPDEVAFVPIAAPTDSSVSDPVVIEQDRAGGAKRPRIGKAARRRGGKARSSVRRPAGPRRLAAMAVLICALLPAAVLFRAGVVGTFPGTATLFRAVGLPVNLVGLSFGEVRSTLSQTPSGPVLEVVGEITNAGRRAIAVPALTIAVEGPAGEPLYRWSARPEMQEVEAGATVPFRARLSAPPPAARRVEVTFLDPRLDPRPEPRDREAVALR